MNANHLISSKEEDTAKIVPSCPTSEGRHAWLMKAGWACKKNGQSREETIAYLHANLTRDPSPVNEVEQAVDAIFGEAPKTIFRTGRLSAGRWPKSNSEEIRKLSASGFGINDLSAASPVKLKEGKPNTARVLQALFPGDPLLCVGSARKFVTIPLSEAVCIGHMLEMIVPSPMTSVWGRTKSGKQSQHTLEATGRRRFLVVEGDGTSREEQASVLRHLARYAPLALVVDSGGKSLHGWFYCQEMPELDIERLFAWACSLGADRQLWLRSQFVRMPDGLRDNGKRQRVVFFNPEVVR